MRIHVTTVLVLLLASYSIAVKWPSTLFGNWLGLADTAVIGPLTSDNYVKWSIQPVTGGEMQITATFSSEELSGSWQTFTTQGNQLLYCGWIVNFFSSQFGAPIQWPWVYQPDESNSTHFVWCDEANWGGCTARWDIWMTSPTTLKVHLVLFKPVIHFDAVFTKVNSKVKTLPPTPLQCNFNDSSNAMFKPHPVHGRKLSACPFFKQQQQQPAREVAVKKRVVDGEYQFCYFLNYHLQYRLQWNFNNDSKMLDIQVSAIAQPGDWIGIGFEPTFPGMNASDIVMGYLSPSGDMCVRPMFAEHYVGLPLDSNDLLINQTQVSYQDGIITMKFSRPFDTGHHPIPEYQGPTEYPFIIIFALGSADGGGCTDKPHYHFNRRGVRAINWGNPEWTFPDNHLCV